MRRDVVCDGERARRVGVRSETLLELTTAHGVSDRGRIRLLTRVRRGKLQGHQDNRPYLQRCVRARVCVRIAYVISHHARHRHTMR
jgi:hypothetical protein